MIVTYLISKIQGGIYEIKISSLGFPYKQGNLICLALKLLQNSYHLKSK